MDPTIAYLNCLGHGPEYCTPEKFFILEQRGQVQDLQNFQAFSTGMMPFLKRMLARPASRRNFSQTTSLLAQHRLPAAYYRGGTSRAVFFQRKHLPKDQTLWNKIFLEVMGSPDPNGRQLDGMGGGISSLSKICVVGPSTHPEADVDYTFVAIGVKDSEVDFSSNCGNMTSAVGPFAIDAGILPLAGDAAKATVRIHNTNTGKIIHSTFPVEGGEAAARGNFSIDGVHDSAARVQLDFLNPAGSRTGKLLPTGSKIDSFEGVDATCIDVGNPCVFVQARGLGVDGDLTPDQIDQHPTLLKRLDAIRRQAGVKMGLAKTLEAVPGSVPKICMVSSTNGGSEAADLRVRAISVGQPHKAVPITVALATAAASKIPGTMVHRCVADEPVDPAGVTVAHASGRLMVSAQFERDGHLRFATVFRTARRLMEGNIYWK